MSSDLDYTKKRLKELGHPLIGIQLKDGNKLFGKISRFTPTKIYLKDQHGEELDVPRRIIQRSLLLLEGEL